MTMMGGLGHGSDESVPPRFKDCRLSSRVWVDRQALVEGEEDEKCGFGFGGK